MPSCVNTADGVSVAQVQLPHNRIRTLGSISSANAGKPFIRRFSRPLSATAAILTCPCHALPLVLLLSGTSLGAFLYQHLSALMSGMGALFLLAVWLLWQTRDSRNAGVKCKACATPETG